MEKVVFKDHECDKCKAELRRQIMQEIHEDVGCLKCAKLYQHEAQSIKTPRVHRVHGRLRANHGKKL